MSFVFIFEGNPLQRLTRPSQVSIVFGLDMVIYRRNASEAKDSGYNDTYAVRLPIPIDALTHSEWKNVEKTTKLRPKPNHSINMTRQIHIPLTDKQQSDSICVIYKLQTQQE